MKFKLILITTLLFMGSAIAAGHITKAQKEKTIECLGHTTVPQPFCLRKQLRLKTWN